MNDSPNSSQSLPVTAAPNASPRFWRGLGLVAVAGVVVLAGYSLHVAVNVPDRQETVILGQTKLAAGAPAGMRMLVREVGSGNPLPQANVEVSLFNAGMRVSLGSFKTGADGSVVEGINVPEVTPGHYTLAVDTRSRLGRDHVESQVEVFRSSRLFLTTDKPLYQPGQTIHLRSLLVESRTLKPLANRAITFEVSDPKGNKVFQETHAASRFGIASADFALASELNAGRYRVQASAEAGTAERTVEVKEYVLPRFKVSLETELSWYRPGQTVAGTVSAHYFFGKPVSRAAIEVSAGTMEEKAVAIGRVEGVTDDGGKFSFRLRLPDRFSGMPQKGGQAFLELTAQVRDPAGHVEQTTASLSVAEEDLAIVVLPEGGALVPGVENLLYVLTAYPDGRPASCELSVGGRPAQTDPAGIAVIPVVPGGTNFALVLSARDAQGRAANATFSPEPAHDTPVLLRTDKAVYRAGQTAHLTVLTTEAAGTVFVDVLRDRQTVLTRSVEVRRGRGDLALELPADLVGTLKLNAYIITPAGEDRGVSRLVHVGPASGLQLEAQADREVYRPGQTARLRIRVRDASGKPGPAALGIAAVDEGVFSLPEQQPGLLAQFLATEGDLLKPRYQLKFFDSPARYLTGTEPNQALAQAYLAGMELAPTVTVGQRELEGYLKQGFFERARQWRGTPAFEALRSDPSYAAAFRALEGGSEKYDLRTATGMAKARALEDHRRRYFGALKSALATVLAGALFMLPIGLGLRRYAAALAATAGQTRLSEPDRALVETAACQNYLLSALFLAQLLWYPACALLFELLDLGTRDSGAYWLAGEVVLAFLALSLLAPSTVRLKRQGSHQAARTLLRILGAYASQMILTRAGVLGFPGVPLVSDRAGGGLLLWLLLAPVLSTCVLLYSYAHRQTVLETKGVLESMLPRSSLPAAFWALVLLGVLAAIAIPNFVKARTTSSKAAAIVDLKQLDGALEQYALENRQPGAGGEAGAPPRVRRHFPETLFWQPELITDDDGTATLEVPLADSITTWRTSIDALTAAGRMGSATFPLRVFQDFFVELDLPVALRLGDAVSLPVTCYNYLGAPQTIRLTLESGDGLESEPAGQPREVTLAANEVRAVHFPLRAARVGAHRLLVTAQGAGSSDAVERELRVLPAGEQVEQTENGVLAGRHEFDLAVPSEAIPGSASLLVKLYPSAFGEIVEGIDSIFQAPYGCFEQTSSTTYPNVLALEYLKRMNRLTPEIESKARKYINAGYQRLLTFEVAGGGFEWFGRAPANVCLTAYGVLEFSDMARVHTVDPRVIERAIAWLAARQRPDGSWEEEHRGETWGGPGSITAFVAWALAESGQSAPCLPRALAYLRQRSWALESTYSRALTANAVLARDPKDPWGLELARQLHGERRRGATNHVFWGSEGQSATYSAGHGLQVETTALATLALMKPGMWPETVRDGLRWVSAAKSPKGDWGQTQATILAMRALLKGSGAQASQRFASQVQVRCNGTNVETLTITPETSEVLRLVSLTRHLRSGPNRVELRQEPPGALAFQWTGGYWRPATPVAENAPAAAAPLKITVDYSHESLAVDDTIEARVSVENRTGRTLPMAMIDLGIPPGFDLDTASFRALQQVGTIERFETTGNQAVLYLRALSGEVPLQFTYGLRAKYPLRVQAPRASVYEYYTPTNRAWSRPATLRVEAATAGALRP